MVSYSEGIMKAASFLSGLPLAAAILAGATLVSLNTASARPVIQISNNSGGQIAQYALRVSSARQNGAKVVFAGRCDSACTLYLSLPKGRTCIRPGAAFGFHLPYGASARNNKVAAKYMLRKYPSWVRSWISSKGGLTPGLKTMGYGYASRFIPKC